MSKILIADDEQNVRISLCLMLHEMGHSVIPTGDGREALKAILASKADGKIPDLLICDIQMPDMSGEDLLTILRKEGLAIPTLVITGHADKETIIRLMRLGCRDVFEKPFGLEILQHRIDAILEEVRKQARIVTKEIELREAFHKRMRQLIHDINNLLGISVGYGDMAFDEAGENEALRKCLKRSLTASQEASRIISTAMEMKIAAFASRKVTTNVNLLVHSISTLLIGLLPDSISLTSDIPTYNIWVEGDADRIQQAILNIGLNAVDAMPQGGELKVILQKNGQDADLGYELDDVSTESFSIIVEDSGHGIAPDTRPYIFKKGFTTKKRGNGIGLATVKEIAGEHKGIVSVTSHPAHGTRFVLTFPLSKFQSGAQTPSFWGRQDCEGIQPAPEKPLSIGLIANSEKTEQEKQFFEKNTSIST